MFFNGICSELWNKMKPFASQWGQHEPIFRVKHFGGNNTSEHAVIKDI